MRGKVKPIVDLLLRCVRSLNNRKPLNSFRRLLLSPKWALFCELLVLLFQNIYSRSQHKADDVASHLCHATYLEMNRAKVSNKFVGALLPPDRRKCTFLFMNAPVTLRKYQGDARKAHYPPNYIPGLFHDVSRVRELMLKISHHLRGKTQCKLT